MSNKIYTKREISDTAIDWARENMPKDFKYRAEQLKVIIETVYSILNTSSKTNVLQAPTGSGKSIIGIVTASLVYKLAHKKSYILVSDLHLLHQYKRDILRYNLDIGYLEGQQAYTCNKTGIEFKNAQCQLSKVPYKALYEGTKMECSLTCNYIQERLKAMNSPITVTTYSFYLIQQNYVTSRIENNPFGKRDVVICDEAHNIPSIIQSHFSPYLSTYNLSNSVDDLIYLAGRLHMKSYENGKIDGLQLSKDYLLEVLLKISKMDNDTQKKEIFEQVCILKNELSFFTNMLDDVTDMTITNKKKVSMMQELIDPRYPIESSKFKYNPNISYVFYSEEKNLRPILNALQDLKDIHSKFRDYVELINEVGEQYVVLNVSKTERTTGVTFNCIFEAKMCAKYLLNVSDKLLFMSATIGDLLEYCKSIGIHHIKGENPNTMVMPDKFNYEKSPIYIFKPFKMSYKEKHKSEPKVHQIIKKLLEVHKNERGIIQTGSYEFANNLVAFINRTCPKEVRDRIISYDNSKDKNDAFAEYVKSDNGILVGPTLVEGIDLKDDLCRFIIMMKVPYGNLGDNLIKAKMNLSYDTYLYDTSIQIQQALGRGIRNANDYCSTYMVDGSFNDFFVYNGKYFNDNTLQRIKYMG